MKRKHIARGDSMGKSRVLHGQVCEMSQDEVAAELGLTRQAVSAIEARALRKMRKALRRVGITVQDVRDIVTPAGMWAEMDGEA